MKILVTGGAGFIGANLVLRLLSDTRVDSVVALDDLSTGSRSNLIGCEEVLRVGSILDVDAVREAMDGAAAVVHLGARPSVPRSLSDPLESNRVNVDGTLNILEEARRQSVPPNLVFASSSSVYGGNPVLPKVETLRTQPLSPYAVSKLAGESYMLAYANCFGLRVLPFRFFNVYGPLQAAGHAYAAVVPAFVRAALDGVALPVQGDGSQTRDFTFVGTVAEILAEAAINGVTSLDPVNLAFGSRSSLLDVIEVLESIVGRPLNRDHQLPRAGDVRDSQADNHALTALFPGVSAVTLEVGLAATVDWMKSLG